MFENYISLSSKAGKKFPNPQQSSSFIATRLAREILSTATVEYTYGLILELGGGWQVEHL
jgi:hypothetical protein